MPCSPFPVLRLMPQVVLWASLAASTAALGQSNALDVAVPFYTPTDFVLGLHRGATAPQAQAFATESARLVPALQALCDAPAARSAAALDEARQRWTASVAHWERLSAVSVGPLVERRSVRQIDFTPTRPELIDKAIRREPATPEDMERIGTPAKGFPALEWLLWTRPVRSGTPDCRYAMQVAADIDREARTLATLFGEAAQREWDEDAAVTAMSEAVNQWVGSLELLRWRSIERPVREAGSSGRDAAAFPRLASDATAASWSAQWQAIRSLAVLSGSVAPPPGSGLTPIETYLRGRGLNPLADRLVQAVRGVDARLQPLTAKGIRAGTPALLAATRELSALKRLIEADIAPALEVNIGFSDADGD